MPTRPQHTPSTLSKSTSARASRDGLVVSSDDFMRLNDLIERYQIGRFATLAKDLEDELERATIVAPTAIPPDIVRMHSKVRFRFVPSPARPAAGPRPSAPKQASDTTIHQGGEADPANGNVDHDEEREVTLVYPSEASVEDARISVLAPIGTALIGLRVGQRIRWTTPEGPRLIEVMAVEQ